MRTDHSAATKRHVVTPSGRITYTEAGTGPVALFVHGSVVVVAPGNARTRCVDDGEHDGVRGDQSPEPELSIEVDPGAQAELEGLGREQETGEHVGETMGPGRWNAACM